jgi:ParB family chromosome partitioning protein
MSATPLSGLAAIPVADIHPSPNNPRERMRGIAELAQSIKEAGLIQPIVVQKVPGKDGYQIVAGHRRHAAVRQLDWPKVPCIIRRDLLPDEELVTMLVENGQRAGLDPIEEARAIKRMVQQMRIMKVDVAQRIGRSYGYVNDRLTLLSLPPEEQEQIRAGHMSLTEGRIKAKLASGRVRPGAKGRAAPGHLTAGHTLAHRAKARCIQLKHSRGRGVGVGGVACGECWESVIRADEREHLHDESSRLGRCVLCDTTTRAAS